MKAELRGHRVEFASELGVECALGRTRAIAAVEEKLDWVVPRPGCRMQSELQLPVSVLGRRIAQPCREIPLGTSRPLR